MKTYNNIPKQLFKWDIFKNEVAFKYIDFDITKTEDEFIKEVGLKHEQVLSVEKTVGKDGYQKIKVTYSENKNYVKKDSEIYLTMLLYRDDIDKDKKVKKYISTIAKLMPESKRLSEKRVNQIMNCLHENSIVNRKTSQSVKGANTYELLLDTEQYITVYNEVLDNENLSISDIVLYHRLLMISDDSYNPHIQFNVSRLAESLKIGRKRMYALLEVLKENSLIKIEDGVLYFTLQSQNNKEHRDLRIEEKIDNKEYVGVDNSAVQVNLSGQEIQDNRFKRVISGGA